MTGERAWMTGMSGLRIDSSSSVIGGSRAPRRAVRILTPSETSSANNLISVGRIGARFWTSWLISWRQHRSKVFQCVGEGLEHAGVLQRVEEVTGDLAEGGERRRKVPEQRHDGAEHGDEVVQDRPGELREDVHDRLQGRQQRLEQRRKALHHRRQCVGEDRRGLADERQQRLDGLADRLEDLDAGPHARGERLHELLEGLDE